MGGAAIEWTDRMLNAIRNRYHIDGPAKLAKELRISSGAVYLKKKELDKQPRSKTDLVAVVSAPAADVARPAGSTAVTNIAPIESQLQIVAMRPEEMPVAQLQLVEWYSRKVEAIRAEVRDANDNAFAAAEAGFKLPGFARAEYAANRRLQFYEKCLAAIQAGFAIVPNFPVDVFAIRVTRDNPKWRSETSHSLAWAINPEKSEIAPTGEGRYVGPQPYQSDRVVESKKLGDGREEKTYQHTITSFDEEPEFPVAIAQPAVLEATRAAMALKIFDEIGCLPARKKPDPIVVGRIFKPNDKWRDRPITFLIAWWIDTRTL